MDDPNPGIALIGVHALWLAACRARESKRRDRILDDQYAAHLAGSLAPGVFTHPRHADVELATLLRVVAIDALVRRAILDHHLHAVVNLGAGLDTRPYRLGLPSDLRWVELDREAVFAYKALRLVDAIPACRVERVGVDLTNAVQRDAILSRVSTGIVRGLMFSEDASDWLTRTALQEIATQVPAGIKWWLVDAPSTDREFVDALCADAWQIVDCQLLEDEGLRLAPARIEQLVAVRGRPVTDDLGAVWTLHRSA